MNFKYFAIVSMVAACCFGGIVCGFGQDDGADISMADINARIDNERSAIKELRQRQANTEREKSLLAAEIESETLRISKLNRTIERAPRRASAPAKAVSFLEAAPASASVKLTPPQNVLSAPSLDARLIDAESQAEIDRLSAMKKDLILERNTLEHVVKQGN